MLLSGMLCCICSVLPLLVTANIVPSSPIVILMIEALCSSEKLVLTRATQHNIPVDGILQLYSDLTVTLSGLKNLGYVNLTKVTTSGTS
jgi:hypothetical protein